MFLAFLRVVSCAPLFPEVFLVLSIFWCFLGLVYLVFLVFFVFLGVFMCFLGVFLG